MFYYKHMLPTFTYLEKKKIKARQGARNVYPCASLLALSTFVTGLILSLFLVSCSKYGLTSSSVTLQKQLEQHLSSLFFLIYAACIRFYAEQRSCNIHVSRVCLIGCIKWRNMNREIM